MFFSRCDFLNKIWKSLKEKVHDIQFFIIGGGEKNYKNTEQVFFTGFLSDPREVIKECSCLAVDTGQIKE